MNRRQFLESAACTSMLTALPVATLAQSAPVRAALSVQTIWDKPEFEEVRGLEIEGRRMWEWKAVSTAFSTMEKMNLNTLIFHWDNIQDYMVLPTKYFGPALAQHTMIQRSHLSVENMMTARFYMPDVIKEAKKRNIKFFFEVTEIQFQDGLEQIYPQILGEHGTLCPTTPFWWSFLRDKYTELFEVLPDLSGVIVSPATNESEISLAMHVCDCSSCSTTTPQEWYTNLIRSMYEPIKSAGKTLVVRDFAKTSVDQNLVMNAVQSVSSDIVAALKVAPLDFYMTYPNNPLIGHEGKNRQWIEADAWGQMYGAGLFPCGIVEYMQQRLSYARARGAVGAWFRTDREAYTDESVYNSFNLLNLIAGAMLSQDLNQDLDNVYKAWLETGLYDVLIPESLEPAPVPIPLEYLGRFKDFMKAGFSIAIKTYYVRGFFFGADAHFPNSVYLFFPKEGHGGLANWEPGAEHRIEPTDENIAAIIAEKDEALAEVEKLPGILQVESLPISDEFKAHTVTMLSLYRESVIGFKLCAIGIFRAKQAEVTKQSDHAQQGLKAADDLQEYRTRITKLLDGQFFPASVYRAFDVHALDSLIKSIRGICTPLAKA